MTVRFTIGDTAPALTGTVNTDLTGAAVQVHIRRPDGTLLDRPVDVVDPVTGTWAYAWQPGDLTRQGRHTVEVEVTYDDDTVQTFAEDAVGRTVTFTVAPQLA